MARLLRMLWLVTHSAGTHSAIPYLVRRSAQVERCRRSRRRRRHALLVVGVLVPISCCLFRRVHQCAVGSVCWLSETLARGWMTLGVCSRHRMSVGPLRCFWLADSDLEQMKAANDRFMN
jgi:hypothetical protein